MTTDDKLSEKSRSWNDDLYVYEMPSKIDCNVLRAAMESFHLENTRRHMEHSSH